MSSASLSLPVARPVQLKAKESQSGRNSIAVATSSVLEGVLKQNSTLMQQLRSECDELKMLRQLAEQRRDMYSIVDEGTTSRHMSNLKPEFDAASGRLPSDPSIEQLAYAMNILQGRASSPGEVALDSADKTSSRMLLPGNADDVSLGVSHFSYMLGDEDRVEVPVTADSLQAQFAAREISCEESKRSRLESQVAAYKAIALLDATVANGSRLQSAKTSSTQTQQRSRKSVGAAGHVTFAQAFAEAQSSLACIRRTPPPVQRAAEHALHHDAAGVHALPVLAMATMDAQVQPVPGFANQGMQRELTPLEAEAAALAQHSSLGVLATSSAQAVTRQEATARIVAQLLAAAGPARAVAPHPARAVPPIPLVAAETVAGRTDVLHDVAAVESSVECTARGGVGDEDEASASWVSAGAGSSTESKEDGVQGEAPVHVPLVSTPPGGTVAGLFGTLLARIEEAAERWALQLEEGMQEPAMVQVAEEAAPSPAAPSSTPFLGTALSLPGDAEEGGGSDYPIRLISDITIASPAAVAQNDADSMTIGSVSPSTSAAGSATSATTDTSAAHWYRRQGLPGLRSAVADALYGGVGPEWAGSPPRALFPPAFALALSPFRDRIVAMRSINGLGSGGTYIPAGQGLAPHADGARSPLSASSVRSRDPSLSSAQGAVDSPMICPPNLPLLLSEVNRAMHIKAKLALMQQHEADAAVQAQHVAHVPEASAASAQAHLHALHNAHANELSASPHLAHAPSHAHVLTGAGARATLSRLATARHNHEEARPLHGQEEGPGQEEAPQGQDSKSRYGLMQVESIPPAQVDRKPNTAARSDAVPDREELAAALIAGAVSIESGGQWPAFAMGVSSESKADVDRLTRRGLLADFSDQSGQGSEYRLSAGSSVDRSRSGGRVVSSTRMAALKVSVAFHQSKDKTFRLLDVDSPTRDEGADAILLSRESQHDSALPSTHWTAGASEYLIAEEIRRGTANGEGMAAATLPAGTGTRAGRLTEIGASSGMQEMPIVPAGEGYDTEDEMAEGRRERTLKRTGCC